MSFRPLFLSKGLGQSEASRLAAEVSQACPWLDFKDEVSESLADELLSSDGAAAWRSVVSVTELVEWYNGEVRHRRRPHGSSQPGVAAYADLCQVVSRFGTEDAFGDGDFWVVADSFSSSAPAVVSFQKSPLPEGLPDALKAWRSRHPEFDGVSIADEDGNLKLKV